MRMIFTAVEAGPAVPTDVLLEADPAATVDQLAAQLVSLDLEGAGTEAPLYVGSTRLEPHQPVAQTPLRPGSVLRIGPAEHPRSGQPDGLVELRLVSGPSSGTVHRLGVGEFRIGAGRHATVRLPDAAGLSGPDLQVRVTPDGRCVLSANQGTSARLDGAEPAGETVWPVGGVLQVGRVLVELARASEPDAALQPSPEGGTLDFNRPPRVRPPVQTTRLRLPVPPPAPDRRPIPLVTSVLPLVLAIAAVVFFHNLFYLLIGVLAPVTAIGSFISNRRHGATAYRLRLAEYQERRARIEVDAGLALRAEEQSRRADAPDAAVVSLTAVTPRRTLWERRLHDDDFLVIRVGTATQPSSVVVEDPTQDEHRRDVTRDAVNVPVTIPVRRHGVVGLAGPRHELGGLARWVVGQSAVLHSPTELKLCLLLGQDGPAWDWARWLPHLRGQRDTDPLAFVGTDTESVAQRLAELTDLLSERRAAASSLTAAAGQAEILVVCDGARRLRSLPGMVQLLREGPKVGIYWVCLEQEEGLLPEECQAVVAVDGTRVRVLRTGTADLSDGRVETVSGSWAEAVSRALAPLRDVTASDAEGIIPSTSRLLDVLHIDPPDPDPIAVRWQLGGRTTEVVVGESLDGPFALDLRADGPHALVAGTTGSGKSEFLQTLVASLATVNRPDAMTFVLIDYKGGSAFKECAFLPHTVGMVTDLDPHLVERALTSLSAELRRREHLLASAGAKDIEAYVETLDRDQRLEPLPRLVIVIDEFASMARELPEFVSGLVNLAQRGRSLGIHLILATQRPAGVVSNDIRANTNLRVGLRMTDVSESLDVIGTPDAAHIAKGTPGRAYARLGHASLLPFQSARVGGRRPDRVTGGQPDLRLMPVSWLELGRPAREPGPAAVSSREPADTDLSALVAAVRTASHRLDVPPQRSPWLAPLPDSILLDRVAPTAARAPGPAALVPAPYGLIDLPAEQVQRPVVVDLATFEHLHVVGSPRTGRSQTLRTIAGSLATHCSTRDVHLYGIDCGNGALLSLTDLPHCGAVVSHTDPERLVRLLARLTGELSRRQTLLSGQGFADLNELRAAVAEADPPPHLVIMVDRWEVFDKSYGDYDAGSAMEAVLRLFREGAGAGIHVIAAGDRQLFATKVSPTTEEKLLLRLNDRNDYGMAGIRLRDVPESLPAGRGLRIADAAEVQIALLVSDPGGMAQARALQEIGKKTSQRDISVPRGSRPFRVQPLPARVSFDEATRLRPPGRPALWAGLGVGGDDGELYGVDLSATATWLVAGPPRSGRSTALHTMVRSLLATGNEVIVVAPGISPLHSLAGTPGVIASFHETGIHPDDFDRALQSARGPVAVFVDDAELLREAWIGEQLGRIAQRASGPDRALVLAGESAGLNAAFVSWLLDAKRNRQGMLLSPRDLADGDLIGVRLSRSLIGGPMDPGRALVHFGDGRLITVRVPSSQ